MGPLMLRDDYAWLLQKPTRIAEALERLRLHTEAGNTGAMTLAADLLYAAGRVEEGRRLRQYGWEPKGWIQQSPRPWRSLLSASVTLLWRPPSVGHDPPERGTGRNARPPPLRNRGGRRWTGYQPRARHSARWGRSVPMVVSLPWPG